jgi:hypothetical protein
MVTDAAPLQLEKKRMRLGGLKGGINAGRFFGTLDDTGVNYGLTLGAFLHFEINDRLTLQPEILLTDKGSDVEGVVETLSEALLFIEVPLLARYTAYQTDMMRLYGVGGPSVAYLIDANIVPESERVTIDLALHAGIGVDLGLSNHDVHFELRLAQGIRNLIRDESDERARSSVISVLTGITL